MSESYKKKEHATQIWVHPDFKNKIKIDSTLNNMSILKYTEKIAKKKNLFGENNDEKEPKFGFRF